MNRSFLPPPAALLLVAVTAWLTMGQVQHERSLTSLAAMKAESKIDAGHMKLLPFTSDVDFAAAAGQSLFQPLRAPWSAPIEDEFIEPEFVEEEFFEEEDVVVEAEPEFVPPPSFRLLGATNEGGDARALLLLDEYSSDERWVSLGEQLAGWTVVEILPQRIRLSSGSEDILIEMYR